MATERLDTDLQGTPTDQITYRRMIGGLMYLTASREDIAFATFDSGIELIAYSKADHAGCKDDCKSTSGGLQFLDEKLEDGSKYRLKFVVNRKELTLTLDDFRTIFQLPQAIDNNHEHFVAAPKFSEMIMKMLYCFVNNIHVDYADLIWEGLHYSLKHPSTLIPYPKFTKLIVSQYMTAFPEILRRDLNKYHYLDDDMMVKNIFNSGKHKDRSQPIESTHGTHNTTNALRSPNPDVDEGESSALRKSTVIRLRTPLTPIPTTVEADDIILQDTIQLSLTEQKSHNELEVKQNVQKVEEHLIAEEIEKLVKGAENVENVKVDISTLRQDDMQLFSALVEKKGKGKHVEESRNTPSTTVIRSPRIHYTLISSDTKKLQELTITDSPPSSLTPSSSSPKFKLSIINRLLSLFKTKPRRFKRYKSLFDELQGENSAKRQKTSEHGTYVFGESSSGQANESESGPSTSGNQEQLDDFDFWTDSYATDDDELPNEKVSQELVVEMS
ncbi:hypothetical protein Tco_0287318 [Tanacetum coccineum]